MWVVKEQFANGFKLKFQLILNCVEYLMNVFW